MSIRNTALSLVIFASAVPAFAQASGTWYPGEIGFVPDAPRSQLTREQVRAELFQFERQGGRLASGELGMAMPKAAATTQLTREQVRQELAEFVRQGGRVGAGEFDTQTATTGANTRALGASPARSN